MGQRAKHVVDHCRDKPVICIFAQTGRSHVQRAGGKVEQWVEAQLCFQMPGHGLVNRVGQYATNVLDLVVVKRILARRTLGSKGWPQVSQIALERTDCLRRRLDRSESVG